MELYQHSLLSLHHQKLKEWKFYSFSLILIETPDFKTLRHSFFRFLLRVFHPLTCMSQQLQNDFDVLFSYIMIHYSHKGDFVLPKIKHRETGSPPLLEGGKSGLPLPVSKNRCTSIRPSLVVLSGCSRVTVTVTDIDDVSYSNSDS